MAIDEESKISIVLAVLVLAVGLFFYALEKASTSLEVSCTKTVTNGSTTEVCTVK